MSRTRAVAVVIACLWLCAGCLIHETAYSGAAGGVKVGVLGDSITYQSHAEIHSTLDPTYQVQIDATTGEQVDGTILSSVGRADQGDIDRIVAAHPDVVVINLGTNQGPTDLVAGYQALVDRFPDACIVGATVREHADSFVMDDARAKALNAALPGLVNVVVDWNTVGAPYVGMGVHPNEAGRQVLASLYADGVAACLNG
jgi:hypothetical protein